MTKFLLGVAGIAAFAFVLVSFVSNTVARVSALIG